MIYIIYGNATLWTWEEFKEKIGATLVEYVVEESIIKSITYRVKKPIDEKILREFEFTAERLL